MQQDQANNCEMETVLAATTILYGLTILNPWTLVFSEYRAYGVLAQWGTEPLWGGLITAVGLAQLVAVKKDGPVARMIACWAGMALWAFLATFNFLGRADQGFFTALTSPGVAVMLLWAYFLAKRGWELR